MSCSSTHVFHSSIIQMAILPSSYSVQPILNHISQLVVDTFNILHQSIWSRQTLPHPHQLHVTLEKHFCLILASLRLLTFHDPTVKRYIPKHYRITSSLRLLPFWPVMTSGRSPSSLSHNWLLTTQTHALLRWWSLFFHLATSLKQVPQLPRKLSTAFWKLPDGPMCFTCIVFKIISQWKKNIKRSVKSIGSHRNIQRAVNWTVALSLIIRDSALKVSRCWQHKDNLLYVDLTIDFWGVTVPPFERVDI